MKKYIIILILVLSLGFVACGKNVKNDDKSNENIVDEKKDKDEKSGKSIAEILSSCKRDIDEVNSLRMKSIITNNSSNKGNGEVQTIDVSFFYEGNTPNVERGKGLILLQNDEGKNKSEIVMSGEEGNPIYIKNNDGNWQVQKQENQIYHVYPNYKTLYSKLLQLVNDLKMEETEDIYKFSSNEGVDFSSILGSEFGLKLTGVNPKDVKQELFFEIDKESNQMTNFECKFNVEIENSKIDMDVDLEFSEFNSIGEDIATPPEI